MARIYDPRRAEIYQRLGIPTVATVTWTIDRVLQRMLPKRSPPNGWMRRASSCSWNACSQTSGRGARSARWWKHPTGTARGRHPSRRAAPRCRRPPRSRGGCPAHRRHRRTSPSSRPVLSVGRGSRDAGRHSSEGRNLRSRERRHLDRVGSRRREDTTSCWSTRTSTSWSGYDTSSTSPSSPPTAAR